MDRDGIHAVTAAAPEGEGSAGDSGRGDGVDGAVADRACRQRTPYTDPATGSVLAEKGDGLLNASGERVGWIRDGVARFVEGDDYAGSFGFQWHAARASRSEHPVLRRVHHETLDARSGFHEHDFTGMRCLEIGCGSGDDTDYLLGFPFSEICSFDLSRSVDRVAARFDDPRLRVAQADVNAMPYPDAAFDVVFFHRVLQHTPHPAAALARAARKVKPGGLLFVHSYHRSLMNSRYAKYKYRWLTRRLPASAVWHGLRLIASPLHGLNSAVSGRWAGGREFVRRWSPLMLMDETWPGTDRETLVALEVLASFDALTPRYDQPMWSRDFVDLIGSMGFEIIRSQTEPWQPLTATAVRTG
jgi:SAM-dependent methyltransferase